MAARSEKQTPAPPVDKSVLEFGAGQSTLWWAKRAQHVLALEANKGWHEKIAGAMPQNVELHLVSTTSRADCVAHVEKILGESPRRYDVVVIDWPYRYEMAGIARTLVTEDGLIICDDAELHDIHEAFKDSG